MCWSSEKLGTRGHRLANYADPVARCARLLNRIAVPRRLWRGSGNLLNCFNNLGGNRLIDILLDVLLDNFDVLGIYRTSMSAPWELPTRTSNIPTLILAALSLEAIFVLGVVGDKTFVAVDGVGDSGCLALKGVERVARVARVTRARFGVLGSSSSTGSCLTTIASPASSSSCIVEILRFARLVLGEITDCY